MSILANLPINDLSIEELTTLIKDLESIRYKKKESYKIELRENIANAIKKYQNEFPYDPLITELEEADEARTVEVDLGTFSGFIDCY